MSYDCLFDMILVLGSFKLKVKSLAHPNLDVSLALSKGLVFFFSSSVTWVSNLVSLTIRYCYVAIKFSTIRIKSFV